MEIITNPIRKKLKAIIFDFDGTISTLRHGWEEIMEPLMLEMIAGPTDIDEALVREVKSYIDESTGVQTYYQMKWLAEAVKRHGRNPNAPEDPWVYKDIYNGRIIKLVKKRRDSIISGEKTIEDFLVKGSREFLEALCGKGVGIYVASGTDEPDVKEEANSLGLVKYFKEIAGAPLRVADCSKEAVLRKLIGGNSLYGSEIAVFGDGKVEIALGKEAGAVTVGVASDEINLKGVNPVKRNRLIKAGANVIIGDFENRDELMTWLF